MPLRLVSHLILDNILWLDARSIQKVSPYVLRRNHTTPNLEAHSQSIPRWRTIFLTWPSSILSNFGNEGKTWPLYLITRLCVAKRML